MNAAGEVEIPRERIIGTATELFGEKIYEETQADIEPMIDAIAAKTETDAVSRQVDDIIRGVKEKVRTTFVAPVVEQYDIVDQNGDIYILSLKE